MATVSLTAVFCNKSSCSVCALRPNVRKKLELSDGYFAIFVDDCQPPVALTSIVSEIQALDAWFTLMETLSSSPFGELDSNAPDRRQQRVG